MAEIKRTLTQQQKTVPALRSSVPAQPVEVERPRGVCFMIRMACVEDIGPMDDNFFIFCEEVDWAWRAKQAGWKRYLVPAAEVDHINHASVGHTGNLIDKIHMQSDYYYFYKHFGLRAWLGLRAGNMAGAWLAYVLAFLAFVRSDEQATPAKEHLADARVLWMLATLTKKVLPPDAR